MSTSSPYMPLYVGDYLRDTRRLSPKEHGAYLLLLMELWQHDGEMEESARDIQLVTGLTKDEYRTVWLKKLRPFFVITDGKIRHKRVDAEMARRAKMVQKRRNAGAKGGLKTQQKQRALQANAQASQAKGLASPFQGERPSRSEAPDQETKTVSHVAADSAPLPAERGRGLSACSEAEKREATDLLFNLGSLVRTGAISTRDLTDLREAVIGAEGGSLIVADDWKPAPHVAAALDAFGQRVRTKHAAPTLKAIPGGKS